MLGTSLLTAIATLIGVFGGSYLSHSLQMKREEKKENIVRQHMIEDEQRKNEVLINKSLNKVLNAAHQIVTYGGYSHEIHNITTYFNSDKYRTNVRPALYENFELMSWEIKQKVMKIDSIIENEDFSDFVIPHSYDEALAEPFFELMHIIRKKYGYIDDQE